MTTPIVADAVVSTPPALASDAIARTGFPKFTNARDAIRFAAAQFGLKVETEEWYGVYVENMETEATPLLKGHFSGNRAAEIVGYFDGVDGLEADMTGPFERIVIDLNTQEDNFPEGVDNGTLYDVFLIDFRNPDSMGFEIPEGEQSISYHAARAFVNRFNDRECQDPVGFWAVMRRVSPVTHPIEPAEAA